MTEFKLKRVIIPWLYTLDCIIDLCSAIRITYGEISSVTGEPHTNYITIYTIEKRDSFAQIVEGLEETHLLYVSVRTKFTSSERSGPGLKSAYQPGPCFINSGFTSSALACAQCLAGNSGMDGSRASFCDLAGTAPLSFLGLICRSPICCPSTNCF